MNDLLPPWPLLSVFLIASFVLAITPGPGVFYIVTRSLVQGCRSGLLSVCGVAVGNFGNACIASAGLAALFAVSSVAFFVVKFLGALYLVYLGLKMLRAPQILHDAATSAATSLWRVFLDGFIVALFNPKTAVFYAAFLPQFLDSSAPPLLQTIVLGGIFVLIAAVTDSAYALMAGVVAPWLHVRGLHRAGRRLGGGMFIGLGLFAALAGSRGDR
jgi:threonine/homoserine/homoserine lactone efflux protein